MSYKPTPMFMTTDIIIEYKQDAKEGIVLIERKYKPYGIALPGGFVEPNDSFAKTAEKESKEETGLDFIEKSIVHMWNGLLEYWIPYREARHDPSEQQKLKTKLGITTKEYLHQNKHKVTTFSKEKKDSKAELREFIEGRLNKDKAYKQVCMRQAQPCSNVKGIDRI